MWDLFMVWVASANLCLILFDFSYLVMRPLLFRYLPVVTRVYDPVKGIEPHPLTDGLQVEADATAQLLALDPRSPGLADRVAKLELLTLRVLEENPFERSGQTRNLEILKLLLAAETDRATLDLGAHERMAEAVDSFWDTDPELLGQRLQLFDAQVRPLLAVNYFREFDLDGDLVDHFWILDLPFLTLFVVEFSWRWALALRHKTYPRWFLFPIANWYDLLGLTPFHELRIFRLFRIASIYMRLRRSDLSRVGKDVLSRAVAYVSNIIAEEISDAVALRILSETQDELRDGTHLRIWDRAVASRRRKLEEVTIRQIREVVGNPQTLERIRKLLRINLDAAVEHGPALRSVPLPSAVLRPLVHTVGEAVLETFLQSLRTTLDSDQGRRAAQELVAAVMDQVLEGPGREVVAALAEEIGLDVIESMKQAVAVKKWALPERKGGDAER